MSDYGKLNHTVWDCKFHVVFIPKYRKKKLFGELKRELGSIFHDLARQKECKIEEGHIMPDHVHMLLSVPPKVSLSQAVGFIKGKSAIQVARQFGGRQRNFTGSCLWARGYFVSTVGRDEEMIRSYIKNQDAADLRLDRLLFHN